MADSDYRQHVPIFQRREKYPKCVIKFCAIKICAYICALNKQHVLLNAVNRNYVKHII
jgi:hypothetical protein